MAKQTKQKQPQLSWQENLHGVVHDLVYLLAAVTFIFVFFVRLVSVSGSSMVPTLAHGDKLIVLSNVFYQEPEAGDIIVASVPTFEDGEPIVKRVIATEGQKVDILYDEQYRATVYVDDVALTEPYINPTEWMQMPMYPTIEFPVTVPEGCIFAMGDNRNHSADSRYVEIGVFDERYVLGKVLFIIMPGSGEDGEQFALSRIGGVD